MAFTFQQPGTVSFLTEIEAAAHGADSGFCIFAFATAAGVRALFGVPALHAMLQAKKAFHLIVGVDSITNAAALLQIQDFKSKYGAATLTAEVFFHKHPGSTFHPKFLHFHHGKKTTALTGSGNLTGQGLGIESVAAPAPGNWEAFSVQSLTEAESTGVRQATTQWVTAHRASKMLRALNDEAVRSKAMANGLVRYTSGGGAPPVKKKTAVGVPDGTPAAAVASVAVTPAFQDILVRELPRNRPGQADIGKDALSKFFGYAGKAKDVLLQLVTLDDQLGQTEAIRLFVNESQNYRLELHAMKGMKYVVAPDDSRMVLVATRLDERSFRYTVVEFGIPGHAELIAALGPIQAGRRFMREKVVSGSELQMAWPLAPTNLLPVLTDLPAV